MVPRTCSLILLPTSPRKDYWHGALQLELVAPFPDLKKFPYQHLIAEKIICAPNYRGHPTPIFLAVLPPLGRSLLHYAVRFSFTLFFCLYSSIEHDDPVFTARLPTNSRLPCHGYHPTYSFLCLSFALIMDPRIPPSLCQSISSKDQVKAQIPLAHVTICGILLVHLFFASQNTASTFMP